MTLSQDFLKALEPKRDEVFSAATGEAALQRAVRQAFVDFSHNTTADPGSLILTAIGTPGATSGNASVAATTAVMPADVWARIAAVVQVEASKMASSKALNPDSVLLSPDPLLAPRKPRAHAEEDFDLASPKRFIFAGFVAFLVGVALTIFILTRPALRQGAGATQPATTTTTR